MVPSASCSRPPWWRPARWLRSRRSCRTSASRYRPACACISCTSRAFCCGASDHTPHDPLRVKQNRELQIMKQLKHSNVVELKCNFYSKGEKVYVFSRCISTSLAASAGVSLATGSCHSTCCLCPACLTLYAYKAWRAGCVCAYVCACE